MQRMRTISTSKRKQRGRPTVLNAALTKRICTSIHEGSTLASAAVAEGISERTLFNWLDRGEAGEVEFAAFFFSVSRARAAYKSRLLKIVNDAAEKDARCGQWLLESGF